MGVRVNVWPIPTTDILLPGKNEHALSRPERAWVVNPFGVGCLNVVLWWPDPKDQHPPSRPHGFKRANDPNNMRATSGVKHVHGGKRPSPNVRHPTSKGKDGISKFVRQCLRRAWGRRARRNIGWACASSPRSHYCNALRPCPVLRIMERGEGPLCAGGDVAPVRGHPMIGNVEACICTGWLVCFNDAHSHPQPARSHL